jgi:hypothetical protein
MGSWDRPCGGRVAHIFIGSLTNIRIFLLLYVLPASPDGEPPKQAQYSNILHIQHSSRQLKLKRVHKITQLSDNSYVFTFPITQKPIETKTMSLHR